MEKHLHMAGGQVSSAAPCPESCELVKERSRAANLLQREYFGFTLPSHA